MGNSCGVFKKTDQPIQHITLPVRKVIYTNHIPTIDIRAANIGPYLAHQTPTPKQYQRLVKWNKMYTMFPQDSDPLLKYRKDPRRNTKFFSRISKGPPPQYRWHAWTVALNLSSKLNESVYHSLPLATGDIAYVVYRDLNRTFPEHAYFDLNKFGNIGQAALNNVLLKYAAKYPEVEYCQGMNFLAGFLLMASGGNELETYFMVEHFLSEWKLEDFYKDKMPGLKKCNHIFNNLFKIHLPKLFRHFRKQEVPNDLWISKWIMTVYTMTLSFETLLRIWDLFIARGMKIVYKIALALLYFTQNKLLKQDLGGIAEILKSIKEQVPSTATLISTAMRFKIPNETLHKLEKGFKQMSAPDSPKIKIRNIGNRRSSSDNLSVPLKLNLISTFQEDVSTTTIYEEVHLPHIKRCLSFSSQFSNSDSNVPVLPDIKRKTLNNNLNFINDFDLEDKALEQLENLSDEEVSMVDAKLILAELLMDRNKESIMAGSVADLPGKQESEIDIKDTNFYKVPVIM